MTRRYITLMAAIAAFAGTVGHVAAQPAAPGATATSAASAASAATVKRADGFFKQGVRLYSDKKWAEAEAAFLSAWALNPTFDVAYNLGSAEYQLGKHRGAAEHLSFALHHWPLIDATSSLRKTAEQRFGESRAMVATLTVKVNVPRAEVFVDGKVVGRSPLEEDVFVDPGAHTIEGKLDGYDGAKEAVQAAKGSAQVVTLALVANAPAASTTAASSASPEPAASGVASAPTIEQVAKGGPNKGIVIAGGATAGAALIAGVVFTVLANGKAGAAQVKFDGLVKAAGPGSCAQLSAACQDLKGLRRDTVTFTNVAGWSFVGAGALAAATVVYALATKSTPKVGVEVAPVVTASGGGVVIGVAW